MLLLLVACSLILVTASFGDGLRSIERGALEVFGPVQEGASRVLEPFRDAAAWVGDTIDAKGDVEKLRAERTNNELRAMLKMDQRLGLQQQGAVNARVYVRSPTVWYSTVTINKGSADGVREGDPVVNGAGLVGRIRRVSRGSAQVLLITDGESGVSARVNESNPPASGIVQTAVGDPNDLRLEYPGRNDRVRQGQTVVTAGSTSTRYPSRFPPDIPIGRVIRVDQDEGTVHVRPYANVRELEFVQVLTEPAL